MIAEKVKRLAAEQSDIDESDVSLESKPEDLGFDSLDQWEFIMGLEEDFDIEISDEDAEKFTDVASVVNYIQGGI